MRKHTKSVISLLLIMPLLLAAAPSSSRALEDNAASLPEDSQSSESLPEDSDNEPVPEHETLPESEPPAEYLSSGVTVVDAKGGSTFSDVNSKNWYYTAFSYCESKGAFAAIPLSGKFDGSSKIDRGMCVTILFEVFGDGREAPSESPASDISAGDYYIAAADWAIEAGIITGYEDGLFHPERSLSREQMMCVIARVARYKGCSTEPSTSVYLLSGFSDAGSVSSWAENDVRWCVQQNLISGVNGALNLSGTLSRAESVQVIYNLSQWLSDSSLHNNAVPAKAVSQTGSRHNAIQSIINSSANRYGAVGMSVAIIENGVVTDTFAYGYAIKGSMKMTADTKVRMGSVTKTATALATMISVENGVMSLDASIGDYWGFKIGTHAKGDVVSARSILTHTSSIVSTEVIADTYYSAMAYRLKSGTGIDSFASGNIANWMYNNYAVDVLGVTVELANNRELDDILDEYIYGPLNIDAAFYGGDLKEPDLIATIYNGNSIGRSAETSRSMHSDGVPGSCGTYFAGGLMISAYDLAKIIAMMANDGTYNGVRYLPASIIANMEYHGGNRLTSSGYYQCQPLRYRKNMYGQSEMYYHTGSAYGVYNLYCYNPNTRNGVVVFSTGATGTLDGSRVYAVCGNVAKSIMETYMS